MSHSGSDNVMPASSLEASLSDFLFWFISEQIYCLLKGGLTLNYLSPVPRYILHFTNSTSIQELMLQGI